MNPKGVIVMLDEDTATHGEAGVVVRIEPELVDKTTTCAMLGGISRDKLEALMRAGEIVPRLIGGRVVFTVAEIRRFAAELPSWAPRR